MLILGLGRWPETPVRINGGFSGRHVAGPQSISYRKQKGRVGGCDLVAPWPVPEDRDALVVGSPMAFEAMDVHHFGECRAIR